MSVAVCLYFFNSRRKALLQGNKLSIYLHGCLHGCVSGVLGYLALV